MKAVQIAGVGATRFGKFPERKLRELVGEAVGLALRDAEVNSKAIEAVFFGNAAAGLLTGQEMIRGQVEMQLTGIQGVPVFNIENACASASSALHLACQAVEAGRYTTVLVVGAEKMTGIPKGAVFRALNGALDVETIDLDEEAEARSPFMDVYAEMTARYQSRSPATAHDFALVAEKNQRNGLLNPIAQYGGGMSAAEILGSRQISGPLTLYMCSAIGDGAVAAVISASGEARSASAVEIRVIAHDAVLSIPAITPSVASSNASMSASV